MAAKLRTQLSITKTDGGYAVLYSHISPGTNRRMSSVGPRRFKLASDTAQHIDRIIGCNGPEFAIEYEWADQ